MSSQRPSFVLNEHRKPRLHFDLRLEQDGVLRSWAVPKGQPTRSDENRLAIAVPDHDLADLLYSDADKDVADVGWWQDDGSTERRLLFVLHGRGSPVRYALIHTDGQNWLLHKTKDQPSK